MNHKSTGTNLLDKILAIYYLNKAEIHNDVKDFVGSWSYTLNDWELDYRTKFSRLNHVTVVCDVYPRVNGFTDWSLENRTTFYLEPLENES